MLEANNISFSHGKSSALLYDGFSFCVEAGERVALVAPSGYGKTTLCKMLSGFLSPDKGSVLVEGKPVAGKGVRLVQLIGQHPDRAIDPCMRMSSVLREAGALDARLMDRFGLREEWLSRYPHELSGGQLQRFVIVRALMANPRYIVADEMTTMLDAVSQARVWHSLLEELSERDAGLVFVSHVPSLVERIATRTVLLSECEGCRPAVSRQPMHSESDWLSA